MDEEIIQRIRKECYNQSARVCLEKLLHHWFNVLSENVTAKQLNDVLPPSTEKRSSKFNTVSAWAIVIGYHYCTGIDYKRVEKDYGDLNKKLEAVFKSFIEEASVQLEKIKQAWLELIQDKLKNEAEAVSNMESEIKGVKDEKSLRELLQQYCFLSNISLLKYLADKLDLKKSKQSIDELADEREEFYTSLLSDDFAMIAAETEDHEEMNNQTKVEYVEYDTH